MQWTTDLVSGNKKIDDQHIELFERINKLYDAVDEGRAEAITDILGFLEEYIRFHFEEEEEYMREYNYEGYEDHKSMHDVFTKEVHDRIINHLDCELNVTEIRSTQRFISQWLLNHVLKVDLEMIKHINLKKNIWKNKY